MHLLQLPVVRHYKVRADNRLAGRRGEASVDHTLRLRYCQPIALLRRTGAPVHVLTAARATWLLIPPYGVPHRPGTSNVDGRQNCCEQTATARMKDRMVVRMSMS